MVKKALIYNPYFNTLGGGEYYCGLIANFFLRRGYQVEIAWREKNLGDQLKRRFKLDLTKDVFINKKAFKVLSSRSNLWQKYLLEKNFSLIFYVSDGSIPFLFGRNNWLLFQAPFHGVGGKSWLNQLKMKNITQVICYSKFVKKIIDQEYKISSQVVYPALNPFFLPLKPINKENIILSVGRFDENLNSKKQDILIKVFKDLVDQGLKNWQLVLIGGLLDQQNYYFGQLLKQASGYPIKILTNINFKSVVNYYQKAKIYWHAAGFGENLALYPERAEHFGISVLEASICRAIPLVFPAGGIPEIINDANFYWIDEKELTKKTKLLVKKEINQSWQKKASSLQEKFSQDHFERRLIELLDK